MFCMQCGEKLPDEAKFCFKCGFKMPAGEEAQEISKETAQPIDQMELTFVGKIYRDILSMADVFPTLFVENMDIKYPGLDEFMTQGVLGVEKVLENTDKYALDLLHEKGIYHLGEDDIRQYTRKYMGYCAEVLSQLEIAYENAVGKSQEAIAYSNYLKENHSYLVGGGFGIAGAAKGIALAGAVNATIGAFHSYAANARERAISSELSDCKRLIYWNSSFREALAFAMETDLKESIHGICDLFSDLGIGIIPFYPLENLLQVSNIIQAIIEGKVPTTEFEKVALQIIQMYPFHINVYLYAADICPDQKDAYFILAQQYGVDIDSYFSELDENAKPYAEHLVKNHITSDLLKDNSLSFDIKKNIDAISDHLSQRFPSRFCFYNKKGNNHECLYKKLKKCCDEYSGEEHPIFLLDTSAPCNGEEGIVLTDRGVYVIGYTYSQKWTLEDYFNTEFDYYMVGEDAVLTLGNLNKALKPNLSSNEVQFIIAILDFFTTMALYIHAVEGVRIVSKLDESSFTQKLLSLTGTSVIEDKCINSQDTSSDNSGEAEDDGFVECDGEALVKLFDDVFASEKKKPTYYYTEKHTLFHSVIPSSNDWLDRDLRVIRKVYDDFDENSEMLVFYYDCSIGATFKESFLMTDLYFHCRSQKHGNWKIKYGDIEKVTVEGLVWPYIAINGKRLVYREPEDGVKEFAHDLKKYFIPIFRWIGENIEK